MTRLQRPLTSLHRRIRAPTPRLAPGPDDTPLRPTRPARARRIVAARPDTGVQAPSKPSRRRNRVCEFENPAHNQIHEKTANETTARRAPRIRGDNHGLTTYDARPQTKKRPRESIAACPNRRDASASTKTAVRNLARPPMASKTRLVGSQTHVSRRKSVSPLERANK